MEPGMGIRMKNRSRSNRPGRKARKGLVLAFIWLLGLAILDLFSPGTYPAQIVGRPLLSLYQAGMSGLMTHSCPSYPNCSAYAGEALEKHGLIRGILLTGDRLIGEQTRIETRPRILTPNGPRVYDPVSANTFWWPK